MKIRPSSALRNDYTTISELAKVSGEPIFITNKGEDDGVFMSMAAFEEREKMYRHRDKIYEAEMSRLRGDPTYTQEELDAALDDLRDSTDDDYSEGDLDDITLDALLKDRSQDDLEWEKERLTIMLRQLHGISETPSKIQALLMELDHRRAPNDRIRQTVLFTRFYDTLQSIRNYL